MATNVAAPTIASLTSSITAGLQQLQAAGLGNLAGGGPTPAAPGTPVAPGTPAAPGATTAPPASEQKVQIDGTGKPEVRVVSVNGVPVTKYFPAAQPGTKATEITAFQFTDNQQFKISLDYRDGIATGLANLSRIFGARQERVRLLSNALATDANTSGSFNPVDLQKMSLETTTTQQLSEMQKKIFDSMKDSISAWLR